MSGTVNYNYLAQDTTKSPQDYITGWQQVQKNQLDIQNLQAQKQVGQILQQATDANGNTDYNAAARMASQAGPGVAQQMQDLLTKSATLREAQTKQGLTMYNAIGRGSITLASDPSDENVEAVRQSLLRQMPAQAANINTEFDAVKNMQPAQRVQWARTHGIAAMDASDAYHYGTGANPVQLQTGGAIQGGTVDPNTGVITQRGPGVSMTPTPSEYYASQPQTVWLDRNGQVTTDPSQAVRSVQRDIPRGPSFGMPAPGSSGASLPSNAPPPPPGTGVRLGTSYKPPGAAASPGGAGTGSPASPAPAAPAAAPSSGPGVVTAAPQGQPEKLAADVTGYIQDQANYPTAQTRAQNMAHAYDALQQLKSATGKGAQGINDLRSYAQTLGILPVGAVNEQRLYELVNKYTERAMIEAAGGSTTDMGRRMQEQANAGTLLSTPANLEILRNDLGKTMQSMAAYKDHGDKSGAGYLEARAKVADATDPRGFVWQLYSPDEKAKINAEVAKDPTAAAKLHKAIGMSQRLQLQIPGLPTGP